LKVHSDSLLNIKRVSGVEMPFRKDLRPFTSILFGKFVMG
jgi:hypothetical protein